MARTYTYTYIDGTITFDFDDQIIYASSSIESLEMQELVNACREAEYSSLGISYPKICNASGKEYLDVDNGVQVGITLVLLDDWKLFSQKTSGVFRALGGNLVQVSGGDPFIPNLLVTYINILSAASTVVQVSTGSGLSPAQNVKLFSIPSETLTDLENEQLFNIPTETMTSAENEQLFAIPISGSSGLTEDEREHLLSIPNEQREKELLYNRTNTVANKKITNYVAGGDTNVNVTYDSNGIPIKEELE